VLGERRGVIANTAAGAPPAPPIHVVWLKRDLRLHDHEPLVRAAAAGLVVALYVFEPALLQAAEADRGHWGFVLESLAELDRGLRARGGRLVVRRGAMPDELARLDDELRAFGGIAHVHSHQETGNAITFARDRSVGRWLAERGIGWTEYHQDGVVRRLASRDGWSRLWQQRMRRPVLAIPDRLLAPPAAVLAAGELPTLDQLGLPPSTIVERQRGGEANAQALLQTFLRERGEPYTKAMSSPRTAVDACSRLSPHFAHGTISLKHVHRELERRAAEVRELPVGERGGWGQSLRSFAGRLRWHCHFTQKLEDEPLLEFDNMNRAFDGLREAEFDEARFLAWSEGRTGLPMVDACMRSLRHHGWINFRMRAMLVSVAAYHLWLHWRPVGLHLARLFVDFEPGIHWSQVQMQSGTTGINTVRIYSPKKQLLDHDPDGEFVRRWVPELAGVPTEHLAEPFLMTRAEQDSAHCTIGRDYPAPIVDVAAAVQAAKQRIYAARRTTAARAESARVYEQHGSRKRPGPRRQGARQRRVKETP
jgi:deoxyribodipyrimidine photo-lyase